MSSMYGATGSNAGNRIPAGYKVGQLQQFTPEQMQLFQSLFSNLGSGSYLSRLASGDPELFSEMEAPAMRQFAGLQGGLASRFSGMGTGARKSSGFQNTTNQAASEFAQGLQSQRQGLQRQALGDLFNMSNMLLNQRPYETIISEKQKKPSFLEKLFGGGIFGGGGENFANALKLAGLFI